MKNFFKKHIPRRIFLLYHYFLARFANVYYGRPSEKMIVIGVTGTNGKTTTARLIAEVLRASGNKVGFISTAEIQIGEKQWLNDMKMTMPGGLALQKFLKDMLRAGCQYAIIETSSQGVEQYRHIGINYDVGVFTNLTPEHIEAHGGFENYKKAKGKFFEYLAALKRKMIDGKMIEKVSIINLDDENGSYFLQFNADKKYGFTIRARYDIHGVEEVLAQDIRLSPQGSYFTVLGQGFKIHLLGEYNVQNVLAAVVVGLEFGVPLKKMANSVEKIDIPGRMEFINEGQDFTIIVDYAPEPEGMRKLYSAVSLLKKNKIIHVLGSCGGGRDVSRRPILGELAGKNADYVVVTNEDPYDDDAGEIINDVASGALGASKEEGKNLFKILDRREAIRKALSLAHAGDLVLITGKGCEQAIVVKNNKKIPWDDRTVARELLVELNLRGSGR